MCVGERGGVWGNVSGWRRALTAMSFCRFPNSIKQNSGVNYTGTVGERRERGSRRGVVAKAMHCIHTNYFSTRQPQSIREKQGRTGKDRGGRVDSRLPCQGGGSAKRERLTSTCREEGYGGA